MTMRMREAAEIILAGRRAATRVGKEFAVDREKLGRFGGFSTSEMDRIEAAVFLIEQQREAILENLERRAA
jgi:hypothetical protein